MTTKKNSPTHSDTHREVIDFMFDLKRLQQAEGEFETATENLRRARDELSAGREQMEKLLESGGRLAFRVGEGEVVLLERAIGGKLGVAVFGPDGLQVYPEPEREMEPAGIQ